MKIKNRPSLTLLFFLIFASFGATFAHADYTVPSGIAVEPPQTRIETDEESGEIRFIIKGKTAAILTEDGLTVDGVVNGHAFLHGSKGEGGVDAKE